MEAGLLLEGGVWLSRRRRPGVHRGSALHSPHIEGVAQLLRCSASRLRPAHLPVTALLYLSQPQTLTLFTSAYH